MTRQRQWILQNNDIKINSTHHEQKSVIAERSIRTLKHKSYKNMTSVSKMSILIN